MKKIVSILAVVILVISSCFSVLSCSDGGGSKSSTSTIPTGPAVSTSNLTGSAIKGIIVGAEIHLYYFDADGIETEIVAENNPVETDATGAYHFSVDGTKLMGVNSPLIVRTSGGTMNSEPAPVLSGIVIDPMPLTFANVTITCDLSAASSVAAGLLGKLAQELGSTPGQGDAVQIMEQVAEELGVDLSDDPQDDGSLTGMFNECLDQNLDLINTPANNPAVDEFIDYLVANLRSSSGVLDNMMEDPGSPGVDIPAVFTGFGTGELATLLPAGPSGFTLMMLFSDRNYIEDNNTDTAKVAASLMDATGSHSAVLEMVQLGLVSGPGTLLDAGLEYGSGEVSGDLASPAAGNNLVRAIYSLVNGNDITLEITIPAVDLVTDTDGDGFSDGEETLGWTVLVDALGYGAVGVGSLLESREVVSDPTMADTDNDGLDDFTEYLIRTDPTTPDTDGDGLTDYAEWFQWKSNPNSVDTDGDSRGPDADLSPNASLFDGAELSIYRTSPTLADTDGDGKTDFEESDHPARSPLIAELPKLDVAVIDNVDVRLDVAFAEEAGQTRQYGSELTRTQSESSSVYNSHTLGASLTLGVTATAGFFNGGLESKTEFTVSTEHTVAFTSESSRSAQESYSEYTTDARTRTESAATGSMSMGIQLTNNGDITYTISQLGFTARQWLPGTGGALPGSFRTLATLTPALGGGITLAPGSTSPVLQVQATGLNASRVKAFLARPDSLYLEPAYYELENEEGLNFAFLEEVTGPQTARVIIDYGNGTVEDYRVATNVMRDPDGAWSGITMGQVMGHVLAVPYTTRNRQSVEPGAPTNEQILYSVRNLATADNPTQAFWMVVAGSDAALTPGLDFDTIPVFGGNTIMLIMVRDDDGDGLYAAEEQHFRTDDGVATDTDGDGLTDTQEVRDGWDVVLPGLTYHVYSDPAAADQDGDGLDDEEEWTAGTDPSLSDTDQDGLADATDPFPLNPALVVYVKADAGGADNGSSWTHAFTDLQTALQTARNAAGTQASDDDVAEVWVASGTYTPHADSRTVSFELVNNLGIYGGFSGTETKRSQRNANPLTNGTVLSGDLAGDDTGSWSDDSVPYAENSYHVVTAESSIGSSAILDGFMISSGNADDAASPLYNGGGLWAVGAPSLKNLFFRFNHARYGGGLFYVPPTGEEITLENCVFSRNEADNYGGGIYNFEGNMTLLGCEFSQNDSGDEGGGIWVRGGSEMEIQGSEFNYNNASGDGYGGGGLYMEGGSVARIERSRFVGNTSAIYGGGITIANGPDVQVNQCLFWNNTAVIYGGGIWAWNAGSLSIVNSTIYGNESNTSGAGVTIVNSSTSIDNSIIYGNTGGSVAVSWKQVRVTDASQFWMGTTCMENNWEYPYYLGNGNIGSDPMVVDAAAGNFRLAEGSPAIDSGSNYVDYEALESGFQILPIADIDGENRIVDGNNDGDADVDMGAFEYQP